MSADQNDNLTGGAVDVNNIAYALKPPASRLLQTDKSKPSRKVTTKSSDALKAKQAKRKFRSTTLPSPALNIPLDDFTSFTAALQSSQRIFALLGAGLSASSGLATFRGNHRYWRGIEPQDLSDIDAFSKDPVLVWWFFSDRMKRAQKATPNRGHSALAKLAKEKEGFFAVNQNIDGS
jgi:NAD-dependent deacetylase sirtuin 5